MLASRDRHLRPLVRHSSRRIVDVQYHTVTRMLSSSSTGPSAEPQSRPPQGKQPAQRGRGQSFHHRGRGRGGSSRGGSQSHTDRLGLTTMNDKVERPERPRPTHFLSLPLGHHPELRQRVAAFGNALLSHSPEIPGLDDKILVSPRRMHITLGVMNLTESPRHSTNQPESGPPQAKSVQAAIELLHKLRPRILEKLEGETLRVGLNSMDIMRPDKGDLTKAHIMWAGPSYESEHAQRLKRVCEFVNKEFQAGGFVIDERRPLKLHCTVINTSHRQGRRQPFSYADVIACRAFQSIEQQAGAVRSAAGEASQHTRGRKPIAIDLGEWEVDELQVCRMGSWGPEGEYVAVGKISLK